MKQTNGLILAIVLATCAGQGAFAAKVDYGFLKATPAEIAKLAGSDVVNSFDLKIAEEWDEDVQNAALLAEGFKSFETWNPQKNTNEVVIYGSEMAVVVPKVLTQADLDRARDAQFMAEIDSAFKPSAISSDEANSIYQGAQAEGMTSASEFVEKQAAKGKIDQATKEGYLSAIAAQAQKNSAAVFCKEAGAVCTKAVAVVPETVQAVLKGASSVMADIPQALEVLIETKTEKAANATAGITQTGFYANKGLVSLKNEINAYDLGDGTSLLTIKTVVALEKDDLDKFNFIGSYNFVIGESFLNTDEGFMKGLPEVGIAMARGFKEKL